MATLKTSLDPLKQLLTSEEVTVENLRNAVYFLQEEYAGLLRQKEKEIQLKDELIQHLEQQVTHLRGTVEQLSQRPTIGEIVTISEEYRKFFQQYTSETNSLDTRINNG